LRLVLGPQLLKRSHHAAGVARIHPPPLAPLHFGAGAFHMPLAMVHGFVDSLELGLSHGAPPLGLTPDSRVGSATEGVWPIRAVVMVHRPAARRFRVADTEPEPARLASFERERDLVDLAVDDRAALAVEIVAGKGAGGRPLRRGGAVAALSRVRCERDRHP